MSALSFKVLDLDFPAGSKNKTATLVTGENEALLVDAGVHPRRRPPPGRRRSSTPARR